MFDEEALLKGKAAGEIARAITVLSQSAAFKDVPPQGLTKLARNSRKRLFVDGDKLMGQGEPGKTLHVIVTGTVKVERTSGGQQALLAELGPGEVVGDLALLDRGPRSATVTAIDDLETLELSGAAVLEIFKEFPQALWALLRIISARLRGMEAPGPASAAR